MNRKAQKPLNLADTQATYAPAQVPPSIVRDLTWGYNRYLELRHTGILARLERPDGQGPVAVYQQAVLVS